MGQFIYGSLIKVTIHDTTLAHLEAVVGARFRRDEPFYLSWCWQVNTGESRTTVWLHPTISVQYRYLTTRRPALDRDRIAQMLLEANTTPGLRIMLDEVASIKPRSAAHDHLPGRHHIDMPIGSGG
jgi:hypothetical protein